MELFVEQGPTKDECLRKLRSKYGEHVRINVLREKTVRMGGFYGFFTREGVEVSGIVYDDYVNYSPPSPQVMVKKPLDFEEEKRKILENNKSVPTLQQVLKEVQTIKEKLETGAAAQVSQVKSAGEEHPNLEKIRELLDRNDFSPSYSKNILDRARKEFSLETLNDFVSLRERVVEWIGESIRIYAEEEYQTRPRIMVLVGPTGVGKTTTIAKLAAIFGTDFTDRRQLSVRLFTIDNYRIGADQQIESLGAIMEIPVSVVKNYRELKQAIALNSDGVDLILIDTIGRSPRASIELAEMKQLLNACGSAAEYHLAMAATTKSSDIMEILQQFEPFAYRSVILTKLDETMRIGNVVSALAEKGKAVSYITEGQSVPHDIQRASVIRFLINLEGFTINRSNLEKRFPSDESQLIKWRQ
ncbi:MAG: flagellar biosynthesis protein FlhF [Spirochaetaceae bacterium]|jgi:flagellar biosynthesis protein FlhF|nr:flagellar biosynthesis protein FlhF [Spirochaetaceae bacterium]